MATVSFSPIISAISLSSSITLWKNAAIFYSGAGADDGECESDGGSFSSGVTSTYHGYANSAHYYTFVRFATVSIPKDAVINEARVRFKSREAKSGSVSLNCYFHNEANAAAPVDGSEITGASLTAAVAWNNLSDWENDGLYYSIDISSILQDIIDLAGWSNGNSVVVQIRSNGSSDYRLWSTFDYSGGTEKPELYVDFTPPTRSFDGSISASSATSDAFMAGGQVESSISDPAGLDDSITSTGGTSNIDISDSAGLDDSIIVQGPVPAVLTDLAGMGDSAEAYFLKTVADEAGLGDSVNGGIETQHTLSDQAGLDDSVEVLNWSEFLRENQDKYVIKYFCTLTGEADDTTDVVLPISQFQARKRDGEATYLSVVVPSHDNAQEVSDRANGQIIIEMAYFVGDTEQLREEILRVDLENIRTDEGPIRRSITLTGHRTETYGGQITTLTDANYKYVSEGVRRYRFAVADPWLNPGDTVRVGDDEFRAGYITYIISERFRQMEVTEAS